MQFLLIKTYRPSVSRWNNEFCMQVIFIFFSWILFILIPCLCWNEVRNYIENVVLQYFKCIFLLPLSKNVSSLSLVMEYIVDVRVPLTYSCVKEMRGCIPKGFSRNTFLGFRIKLYFFIHCTFCSQLGSIGNLSFLMIKNV